MDHKRGYYLLDHAAPSHQTDYAARKRQKDLSHHQDYSPSSSSCQFQLDDRPYNECAALGPSQTANLNGDARALVLDLKHDIDYYCHKRSKTPVEIEKAVEDNAYKKLLPVVKKELEMRRDIMERRGTKRPGSFEKEEPTCAVCPTPKKFKGWDALCIHAEKFSKENARQHRGYFRALKEALKDEMESPLQTRPGFKLPCSGCKPKTGGNMASTNGNQKPNILIVENNQLAAVERILNSQKEKHLQKDGHRPRSEFQTQPHPPQLHEILAVYSRGGDDGKRNVFVFPASEVGYIDGKELEDKCPGDYKKNNEKCNGLKHASSSCKQLGFRCQDHRTTSERTEPSGFDITIERGLSLKDIRGLKLLDDEEIDEKRGKIFDDKQFDQVANIKKKWSDGFKDQARKFQVQRVFRDSRKLLQIDARFQEDLRRIEKYEPSTKQTIKDQMGAIEKELRKEHLMWLQDVEAVREQFQTLADKIKREEEMTNIRSMRIEKQQKKNLERLEEAQRDHNSWMTHRRIIAAQNRRKMKRGDEMKLLMDIWKEEQKLLMQETLKAKKERELLLDVHDRVHQKALIARKRECPVCFERLRNDIPKDPFEPFGRFYPVNKFCLNISCSKRH